MQAVAKAMSSFGNSSRGGHPAAMAATRAVYGARVGLAPFFGAQPNQIAFTHNATMALNMAINLLKPRDHAITTVLEHNSVLRPLYKLQRCGLSLDFAGLTPDGNLDYEVLGKLLRKNTKYIIATHCSNVTGQVTNLEYLAEFCERHELIMIVDSAQSAGLIPVNMQRLGRAIVCFTGHKGLLGPQGTGGLVVKDVEISPMMVGGNGSNSFSKHHSDAFPDSLETGTLNAHGLAGLTAGAQYIQQRGIEAIREESLALANAFEEGIKGIRPVKILGNSKLTKVPIVSINIGGLDSSEVEAMLSVRGICVRGGFHCAPMAHRALKTEKQGAVRFSFSSFNTVEQVEVAIQTVSEIAKEYT
jgi:cysteine desulfurase family protein